MAHDQQVSPMHEALLALDRITNLLDRPEGDVNEALSQAREQAAAAREAVEAAAGSLPEEMKTQLLAYIARVTAARQYDHDLITPVAQAQCLLNEAIRPGVG